MANSSVLGWVGGGQTVRAWCLTGFYPRIPADVANKTHNNHVNGYNLILDDAKYLAQFAASETDLVRCRGAIPFRFVSPMPDTRYKIFVQPRSNGFYSDRGLFTHALNTPQYPKTVNGFWVRFGFMMESMTDNFRTTITNIPSFYGEILNSSAHFSTYQLQVVVL